MNFLKALLIGIASAIIAVLLVRVANWDGSVALRMASQPAFDRVMKTHTLHCITGNPAPAYTAADAERDLRRNLARDLIEEMGRILNLQIEWVEEVAPEQVAAHLARGEEDAMCLPLWPRGFDAGTMDFTAPIDYVPVYAYARADDARFDGKLDKINDAGMTISVIEDTASKDIADQDFPHATQYAVTEEADGTHWLLAVTTKKADVAFADLFTADNFIKNNPGVLKQVAGAPPVRVFGESFAVAKG